MQFIKYESIIKEETHCHCKLLLVCLFICLDDLCETNALVLLNKSDQFHLLLFLARKKKINPKNKTFTSDKT